VAQDADAPLPDFADAVLAAVEEVPPGRVVSYGDIAGYVGGGGPRQVGRVLALYGGAVSWWRVIRADGRPAAGLEARALELLGAEGVPIRDGRVDLRSARWAFPVAQEQGTR
jgi:alkylated DNA nucleotide flippase Atl1